MANRYKAHQDLIGRFKLLTTKNMPEFRVFDRIVGQFLTLRGTRIIIGNKGACDQYGVYSLSVSDLIVPIHFELESKSGNAKLEPDQIIWQKFCKKRSIPHIIMRDEHQAINEIKSYIYKIRYKLLYNSQNNVFNK